MKLTIDNHDSAGVCDYTAWLEADQLPIIRRVLNQPSELRAFIVSSDPAFVVPAADARVVLTDNSGAKLFTGYLVAAPGYEYLGWGERGPAYRYELRALSDERLLDRKMLLPRPAFIARKGGEILKSITDALLPATFDVSTVEDLDVLPSFSVRPGRPWSEHAADLARRVRACYRVSDSKVLLQPVGRVRHTIRDDGANSSPQALKLSCEQRTVNDLTVVGRMEPRAYVKDYFLGDGLSLDFRLSHLPFTRRASRIVEDEFGDAQLNPLRWAVSDPVQAITTSTGKLRVSGGTGLDGETFVRFAERLELGGALVLQHGELEINSASDCVVGGLYEGEITRSTCVAGFRVTTDGRLSPLVRGSAAGTPISMMPGRRYALTTRVHATEPYRTPQPFYSSRHADGNGLTAELPYAELRLVLEVHELDPANPGSAAAPSQGLYSGTIANAPAHAWYALINAASMHGAVSYVRLLRGVDAEVRSQLPGGSTRTRLVGALSEGAECRVDDSGEVQFYPQYVPASKEAIRVTYRGLGRAVARAVDANSVASCARDTDDGVRASVKRVVVPAPRSYAECEKAALALLEDTTGPHWSGEYTAQNDQFAQDVFPGDAVRVQAPKRKAEFDAVVREVEITVVDLRDGRTRYHLRFANDAAEPLAFMFDERGETGYFEVASAAEFIADLPNAEVTAITSISVGIDAGAEPVAAGGIEVRRSDYGWGQTTDRNLVGRFATRSFNVARLSRVQTYYLRQFDSAVPPRYSQHSTVLHIDYPL